MNKCWQKKTRRHKEMLLEENQKTFREMLVEEKQKTVMEEILEEEPAVQDDVQDDLVKNHEQHIL